jgi:SAM-dependent methyltransferase
MHDDTLYRKIKYAASFSLCQVTEWHTTIMQTQINRFMQQLQKQHPEHFVNKKVLEAGGPAGGGVRRCFSNCSYAVHHGAQVTPIHRLDMPNTFDVIVHAGTLHYDRHWINTLCAMYRNLKSGGALIITCAGPKTALYEDDEPPIHYQPLGIDELAGIAANNGIYHIPDWLCGYYTGIGIFWGEEVRWGK